MACEFKPGSPSSDVICNITAVMGQMWTELKEIYTLAELRDELCNGVPKAREQCIAYCDLVEFGRSSIWAK